MNYGLGGELFLKDGRGANYVKADVQNYKTSRFAFASSINSADYFVWCITKCR